MRRRRVTLAMGILILVTGLARAQTPVPQDGQPVPSASSTEAGAELDGMDRATANQTKELPQGIAKPGEPVHPRLQDELPLVTLPAAKPTDFQRIVAKSFGEMPPIFGTDLFRVPPSTFAPVDNIPVTPDYTIGPGDELRVQIWGEIDQRGTYVVDRTGAIAMPEVGTLHVAGMQFSQVTPFLKSHLRRVYRNFDVNVNLGQLRSMQIFVTGKARQPGSYTIGSMSTLLNALFAAGGPLPEGSLRDIQVKRDGQTVTHFDLYDMILHGDKSKDIRLAPGDLIFIPDVGPQVAVVGSVKTPAVYELRGEKSFSEAIALSGGETNTASAEPVRVERISHHLERSGLDVDLRREGDEPLQDGDIIQVRSIMPRFEATVTLRGNVARPGRRAWKPGMRVSDLIPNSQTLVTQDYYDRQNELGLAVKDRTDTATTLEQSDRRTEGSVSLRTAQGDSSDLAGTNAGQLAGADPHATPGSASVATSAGEALTLDSIRFKAKTDVVLNAPDVDWNYAVIERQNETTLTTTLLPFNLGDVVLRHEAAQDLALLPGDVVTVFSKADIRGPSAQQTKFVKLEGEFVNAGVYSVMPGETLRQLLARAGGLTSDADLFASEFTRESVRRLQQERLREYANMLESESTQRISAERASAVAQRDVDAALSSEVAARSVVTQLRQMQASGRIVMRIAPESRGINAIPDIALEDGDRFLVPKAPSFVSVSGNVYNPSALEYDSSQRIKDYLEQAGSPNRMADKGREFILRANGSVISRLDARGKRGKFDDLPVYPGDTIVVPPKYVTNSLTRNLLNASTIFEGFGLGAAAINLFQ
jgi:protein involved in polysaccharide export with SLBB domain